MAINTTNVSPAAAAGGMAYVLWGNLYVPGNNYKYSVLFSTINVTSGVRAASAMRGLTQGVSPAIAGKYNMSTITQNASQTMNITATCAWTAVIATPQSSGTFQITGINGQVTLQGSGNSAVVGGSGTLVIRKLSAQASSGQVNFIWSNGAGNRNTQGVAIT